MLSVHWTTRTREINMKYRYINVLFATFIGVCSTPMNAETKVESAEEKATEAVAVQNNVEQLNPEKISESFGHLIGKNLESMDFDLNVDLVVKGIRDALAGKESPMSESECVQAISMIQENAFQKTAQKNLEKANQFLAKNAKEKGIVELEEGKLQYRIEKKGKGDAVKEHDSPVIRYVGRFSDGKVFGSSKDEEVISLDETIAGFKKGIVGMLEGEKRTIHIHPELGYGTAGYLPPNELLTFEVELIKANSPQKEVENVAATDKSLEESNEIADVELKEEAIR